nr:pyruvate kinase [Thermodesulfobacteriota bacterium]
MKKTKIIATLGPASRNHEIIKTFIEIGVDVFRLNFSHGDKDYHRRKYRENKRGFFRA